MQPSSAVLARHFSALVHNLNNIFLNEHLYRADEQNEFPAFANTRPLKFSFQSQINPMQKELEELTYYTLNKADRNFIHQHVVDAYAAQNADAETKPITLFFALAGLYLLIEKNYTGKEVQAAHIKMSTRKKAISNT